MQANYFNHFVKTNSTKICYVSLILTPSPPPNLPVYAVQQKNVMSALHESVLIYSFHQQIFGHFLFLLLEVADLFRVNKFSLFTHR